MVNRAKLRRLLQGRRDAIAQCWYEAIASTGFAEPTGPEVCRRLGELTGEAISVLLAEPFEAGRAQEIGAWLARLHYLQPEALGRTLGVLGYQLADGVPADQVGELIPRLVALLEAISTGFVRETCSIVLAEQETNRRALDHELRVAENALREAHDHLEMRVEERTAELARANEALRESEEKYRDLVENINDVIYTIDQHGNMSYVSPSVETFMGYRPSEVVGHNFTEFIYKEDHPKLLESYRNILTGHGQQNEYRVVTKAGEIRCMRTSSRPIMEGTRVVGLHGVLEDVTERRQAEEALRRSEERWRSLVENAPDYIITLDRDGRIQFVNRVADGSGLSVEELLGRDIVHMIVPEQQADLAEAVHNVFETGSSVYCEGAVVRTSGAKVWYGCHLGPIWDKEEVVAAMLVGRDITERRQVDEVKDNLIRDVSHELRTPLAKVQMSLELLSELLEDEQMDRQRAMRISSLATLNVQRLLQTVEGILDLSQLEAGVWTFQRETIQIADLMEETIMYMDALAEIKGLQLVVQVPEELPPVGGDRDKLFRVFLNLVDNAIKFSEGGRIVISAESSSNELEVAVSDPGQGILVENLQRVFERFFQEKTRYQGAGVGLAICRAIVEGHGGRIWAESPGRGQGATFRFTLPILAGHKEGA